ncbi:MAG TPA: anaerobic ribonucleoside-triphosphate reductase activating protein, partial [Gammaproteobacteria bacterium]|nr:anaerobic ribonucleoside-triphosphate reductase activating protein [Gammaproteobacteria bacterium]
MLKIGGLTPMTTIDYPGCLSAVVYCQGCPLDCAYCHNPTLRLARGDNAYEWSFIESFLKKR